MGEVVDFTGITTLPLQPDRVLTSALGKLDNAVVIGWDKDGELWFASTEAGGPEVLWLLEKAKQALLEIDK
jgi:hypothetical protein